MLSAEERERHARFRFEKDRRIFLAAHALARLALVKYTGRDAERLDFKADTFGKSWLRSGPGEPCVYFNLSHTPGMVALAIAPEPEIGVDVEDTRRAKDWNLLARTVFAATERAPAEALRSEERARRFVELWTLKEAYIKARGMGLSLPLDGFSMRIPDQGPIAIDFTAAIADDPAQWHFTLFSIESHRLAVAVRSRSAEPRDERHFKLTVNDSYFSLSENN